MKVCYSQRAEGGRTISEDAQISEQGIGYPATWASMGMPGWRVEGDHRVTNGGYDKARANAAIAAGE
ncbi:hypothetical protein [Thiohalobacter sp.]|uniref:hypothetical protein n=1 Tax=Thiohalobacter sp. TaxID=2025948 RepID=UPI002611CE77|nr:hypothetical protein [Thiohalobacter sp.]